jgi:hypothetical protein
MSVVLPQTVQTASRSRASDASLPQSGDNGTASCADSGLVGEQQHRDRHRLKVSGSHPATVPLGPFGDFDFARAHGLVGGRDGGTGVSGIAEPIQKTAPKSGWPRKRASQLEVVRKRLCVERGKSLAG